MLKTTFSKLFTFFISVIIFWLGIIGFIIEPDQIKVSRINLKVPNLHKEFDGLKVAVLADLHVGSPHIDLKKLEKIVEQTNKEKPDVIVLLGDYVIQGVLGGKFVTPQEISKKLAGLKAPCGVIAILGNHDWWGYGDEIMVSFEDAGIKVLENDAIGINYKGQKLWIGCLADLTTRFPDLNKTLEKVKDNENVILLTHNPDVFPEVPEKVNLTLAGHVHGGQIKLPFIGSLIVPSKYGQRYARGHIVENGRHMFVSRGIGTSILPVRFNAEPEIVILTLKSD